MSNAGPPGGVSRDFAPRRHGQGRGRGYALSKKNGGCRHRTFLSKISLGEVSAKFRTSVCRQHKTRLIIVRLPRRFCFGHLSSNPSQNSARRGRFRTPFEFLSRRIVVLPCIVQPKSDLRLKGQTQGMRWGLATLGCVLAIAIQE